MRSWFALGVLALVPLSLAQSGATVTAVDAGGEPSYHFSPVNLTVDAGAELTVVGGTVDPHTFTHDVPVNERRFDSGQISVGQTKIVRAPTTPGSYPFHCSYHPGMRGVLTVGPSPTPTTTPTIVTGLPAPGAALVTLALCGGAMLLARRR